MPELRSEEFGKLLKRLRVDAGLSQEQLAERARISVQAVGAYERGSRRAPHRDTLALLVEALSPSGTAYDELISAANHARRRGPNALGAASANEFAPRANNLPIQRTTFVGRNHDVADSKNCSTVIVCSRSSVRAASARRALRYRSAWNYSIMLSRRRMVRRLRADQRSGAGRQRRRASAGHEPTARAAASRRSIPPGSSAKSCCSSSIIANTFWSRSLRLRMPSSRRRKTCASWRRRAKGLISAAKRSTGSHRFPFRPKRRD